APRAVRASNGSAPGWRQRARRCPPPPPPRAVDSRPNESPLAELVIDLAAEAVTEREVDESEHRHQQRDRKAKNWKDRAIGRSDQVQQRCGQGQEDAAQPLREVVRLRTVLDRTRLDDSARLQDLEVELLEQ